MTKKEHAKCGWCGTTRSEKWRTSPFFFLKRDSIYCSNDCRYANEVPFYACFSIFLIPIIIILLMLELTTEVEPRWVYIQMIFTIIAIACVLFFLKGMIVRKRLPQDSRITE